MHIHDLRGTRRLAIAVASSAAILIGVAVPTVASGAGLGLLPSLTWADATIAPDAQTVLLTATVKVGAPVNENVGVTPSGTVTFTDDAGDGLAVVTLPTCLLKDCTVSATVLASAFSRNVGQIRASYSGDLLLKPSEAVLPFGFDRCGAGENCDAQTSEPDASLEVYSDSDQGYVMDKIGGAGLPCGVDNGGPVGQVNAYNLDDNKYLTYSIDGDGAEAEHNQVMGASYRDWFCYVAPVQFDAYSQDGTSTDFPDNDSSFGSFGPAPQIGSGPYTDDYVGLLADCSDTDDQAPCIETSSLGREDDGIGPWYFTVTVKLSAGDPWVGGQSLPALPKLNLSGL
ncbi:MAG TPA: Ig-like domain-containing protein [Mycobacteriales bacterium]|nr:Ig-like domain-containing protein [Mycobacteriales bacterium]